MIPISESMERANEFRAEAIARLKARKAYLAKRDSGSRRLMREIGWRSGCVARGSVERGKDSFSISESLDVLTLHQPETGKQIPVGLFNAHYPPVDTLGLLRDGVTLEQVLAEGTRCEFCGRALLSLTLPCIDANWPCPVCRDFSPCLGWGGCCCVCGRQIAEMILGGIKEFGDGEIRRLLGELEDSGALSARRAKQLRRQAV